MPYTPHTWVDNTDIINASKLQNIESGVSNAPYGPDATSNQVPVWNGTAWAYQSVTETQMSLSDVTTLNVSSTKHGLAPKSPASATQFLNGAATPAYAQVKDSDLSLSDITTNNASTSNHGFLKKLDNTATHFMDGTGNWSTPTGTAFSGVKATISAATSCTSGSWTLISWDTEEFDTDGYHSTVSNTNRLTIPTGFGGRFLMIVGSNFAANATGVRGIQVNKNTTTSNSNIVLEIGMQAFTGLTNTQQAQTILSLADADWVSINAFQNSGGALNFANTTSDAYFILYRVSS